MNKEALSLINTFLYSLVVAFLSFDYVFLFPIILISFIKRDYFFKILKKLFYLNFLIIVLVLFVFFQNKNEAIELFFRTNFILFFNSCMFYESKGYDIVRALNSLKFPSKIVSVMYFTLSLIEYLMIDFKKTKNSLKARGFKSNTSMFTYQTYGNIFAMIFIKAIKKSEDMKDSMILRGFEDRIFFLNSKKSDYSQIIILLCIIVIFIKVIYELFY